MDQPQPHSDSCDEHTGHNGAQWPLAGEEFQRYGRQLIMPEIGLGGQLRLKHSAVLVIGVGGLGSPAAAYLAGAGVGTIGLVDGDVVELSNLHRQVVHTTERVGTGKVDSAVQYLTSLNPLGKYNKHPEHITPQTALPILDQYDIVLDCTDHPTTRYLISDACVLLSKPLVSASALRTDGQLIVLNTPAAPQGDSSGGPCYRCVFPKPPPAEAVLSCGEGGIFGPVVGVMGVMQALETVKLLISGHVQANKAPKTPSSNPTSQEFDLAKHLPPSMLIFSAFNPLQQFRTVRLRGRRQDCAACSSQATVTQDSLTSGSMDYVAFCGLLTPVDVLQVKERMSAQDFARHRSKGQSGTLIDVREKVQFELCHLDGSINIPYSEIATWKRNGDVDEGLRVMISSPENPVHFICRFGNDSQLAVKKIREIVGSKEGRMYDIAGGFNAWREYVDRTWPDY